MVVGSKLYTTRPVIPTHSEYPTIQTTNPKVWLRSFCANDLHVFHEIRQQIEVMRWTSKAKIDANLDETRTWLNRFLEVEKAIPAIDLSGEDLPSNTPQIDEETVGTQVVNALSGPPNYGFVVVYDDEDGTSRVIGTMGFLNLNAEAAIGYMFRKEEWGNGFATITAKALLANWYQLDREVVPVPDDKLERVQKILSMAGELATEDGLGSEKNPLPEILHAVTEGTNSASGRVLEKIGFTLEREYTEIEDGIEVPLKDWFRVNLRSV